MIGGRVSFDHDNFRYAGIRRGRSGANRPRPRSAREWLGNLFAEGSASHAGRVQQVGDTDRDAFGWRRYRFRNMDIGYGFDHSEFGRDLGVNGFFMPKAPVAPRRVPPGRALSGQVSLSLGSWRDAVLDRWPGRAPDNVDGDGFIAGNFTRAYRLSSGRPWT